MARLTPYQPRRLTTAPTPAANPTGGALTRSCPRTYSAPSPRGRPRRRRARPAVSRPGSSPEARNSRGRSRIRCPFPRPTSHISLGKAGADMSVGQLLASAGNPASRSHANKLASRTQLGTAPSASSFMPSRPTPRRLQKPAYALSAGVAATILSMEGFARRYSPARVSRCALCSSAEAHDGQPRSRGPPSRAR